MNKPDSFDLKKVIIGYATETGNAFEIAIQTSMLFKDYISELIQMDEYFEFESNYFYVLFISTTGQGDPPYGLKAFWSNLMKKSYKLPERVKFCVYALGDRSYGQNFNIAGRKIRQRLVMLGGQQVFQIVLGDEQDPNGCFDQYFKKFLPQLSDFIKQNVFLAETKIDPAKIRIKRSMNEEEKQSLVFCIQSRQLLSSVDNKQIYKVNLKIEKQSEGGLRLNIGDVLQIYPHNNEETIKQVLQYITKCKLNDISLSEQQLQNYLKCSANLENLVNFTFFTSTVESWLNLDHFIDPQIDQKLHQMLKSKILELGQDYDEYFNYIKKYRRNIREVIADFNLLLPLSSLMQRLGRIISRKYSISQINQENNRISLLVKEEPVKISNNRYVKGLCSYDLCKSDLSKNNARKGNILRNGQFNLVEGMDKELKIVMISLGTGIAPFLTIINQVYKKPSNWKLVLFHSNRYQKQWILQKQKSEKLESNSKLKVYKTFTREKSPIENRRLQFVIEENLQQFEDLQNLRIFICGTKQLCDVVCRLLSQKKGFDIKSLRKQKVICIQNW